MSLPWKFQSADFQMTTPVSWLECQRCWYRDILQPFEQNSERIKPLQHESVKVCKGHFITWMLMHAAHLICLLCGRSMLTCAIFSFPVSQRFLQLDADETSMRQGFVSQNQEGEAEISLTTGLWSISQGSLGVTSPKKKLFSIQNHALAIKKKPYKQFKTPCPAQVQVQEGLVCSLLSTSSGNN